MVFLKKQKAQHGEATQKPSSVSGLFSFVSCSYFAYMVEIWKTKLGNHNVGIF